MLPNSTDVLIVGAGPTGLALAISLQKAGIDYLLIDRLLQGQNTSRAAVVHAHTLEILEELGVSELLVTEGLPLTKFAIRDRDRPLVQLQFDALPSAFRYLLMVPQDVTERILSERLFLLGGSIRRGVSAVEVGQDANSAQAKLTTADGDHSVRAKYIVGADGMQSIVRKSAGIEFRGSTYEESFVLADVKMHWSLGNDEVSLFFSPAGLVVVAPLPNGQFRIVATLDEAPERPDISIIQRLIDMRGPQGVRNTIEEVTWSSRFRLHHRVVDTYRNGRLLLMGDAAHVHSPAGGQGMNTGIVDAVVLGRSLTNVLLKGHPEASLDAYSQLRRPAAAEVLALAGRLTSMATAKSAPRRYMRNVLLRALDRLPPAKTRLIMNLSGLGRKHFADVA